MLQINCTKKLIQMLGVPQGGTSSNSEESQNLGVWYANIFTVEFDPYLSNEYTHQYLLLVNDQSLLSFYVRIPDEFSGEQFLEELPQCFEKCFQDNKFTTKQIRYLQQSYREIHLAVAKNRSMLGYLRSYAMDYASEIRGIYHDRFAGDENWSLNLNELSRPNLIKSTPATTAEYIVSQAMQRKT